MGTSTRAKMVAPGGKSPNGFMTATLPFRDPFALRC